MKRPGRRPGLSIRLLFRRSVAGGHGATGPIEPVVQADLGHPLGRSEEHTSELQSQSNLVCRLLLEKKKKDNKLVLLRIKRQKNSSVSPIRAFFVTRNAMSHPTAPPPLNYRHRQATRLCH